MVKKSYIGVDLHTNRFNACYIKKDGSKIHHDFELTTEGLNKFKETLYKGDEIAVEATSNASYFKRQLRGKVKKVTVVAPSKFFIIGKSTKKTDAEDAEKLAFFLSKKMLPKARLKSKSQIQLMSFIDDRLILVKLRNALINKTHSITVRNGFKIPKSKLSNKNGFNSFIFTKSWPALEKKELKIIYDQIQSINENIKKFEVEIDKAAQKIYGYENLLSIKGIGPLSAAIFLAVIGDINDFPSAPHLCSYFGIVPKIKQSNETNKKCGISKSGSKIGRSTLVQCAWISIRYNDYLNKYYERIKNRGAPKKAIIACSRKLLTTIYYTLKNDWIFDDFSEYRYHVNKKNK